MGKKIKKCSSSPHQILITDKLKQCTSCLHSGFAWQEWMGLWVPLWHQGFVVFLEDGFSFYKLTKRPTAHRTGLFLFVFSLYFFLLVNGLCWNYEAKNSKIREAFAITSALKTCTHQTLPPQKHTLLCQVLQYFANIICWPSRRNNNDSNILRTFILYQLHN